MKYIYGLFIIIMMGKLTCSAQEFDIELTGSESGNKTHEARNSITFGPNYSYTPAGGTLTAEIVDPVVGSATSYAMEVDAESRSLNTAYAVGATRGLFSVNSIGGAEYTIPLQLPGGIAGLSPSITLNYSSHSGNGVAGFGWNIGGISAITRSPQTHYYDNAYCGVNLSSSDRFSLDGQRLVCTSGTYGGNGSVYRTENDIFSRVTCYTGSYGADKFEVKTKSGLTYQYGYTNDASQTISGIDEDLNWFVNEISDVYGNTIEFDYIKDEGLNYIGEINYGPNKITFHYSRREDKTRSFFKGEALSQELLLDEVVIEYNSIVVKKYTCTYNYKQGKSVLNEFTEYGAGGSTHYNSTAFNYKLPGAVAFAQTTNNSAHSYITYKTDLYKGDFNGDGLADFLCLPNAYASWSGYKVYYGDGVGNFNYAYQNTTFSFGSLEDVRIIDIDSDGREDIIYETVSGGTSTFRYVRTTGSAFSSSTVICSQASSSVAGISGKKNRKTLKQENDNEPGETDYWR